MSRHAAIHGHLLDLTKQIVKNLPWEPHLWAGSRLFNSNWFREELLTPKATMLGEHTLWWRRCKILGLKGLCSLRRTTNYAVQIGRAKKGLQFAGRIKIGWRGNGKRMVVLWVQVYPVPEWWVHQDRKSSRWSDVTIMPSDYCTSLWGQYYNVGLHQDLGLASVCAQRVRSAAIWTCIY